MCIDCLKENIMDAIEDGRDEYILSTAQIREALHDLCENLPDDTPEGIAKRLKNGEELEVYFKDGMGGVFDDCYGFVKSEGCNVLIRVPSMIDSLTAKDIIKSLKN